MPKRDQNKFEKQPIFEDYLKPNPLIQSWMLPFLPDHFRAREFIFAVVAAVLWVLVFEVLLLVKCPEWFCVPPLLVGIAFLGGDLHTRFMIAGMKFGQAKREFREAKPLPDSETRSKPRKSRKSEA